MRTLLTDPEVAKAQREGFTAVMQSLQAPAGLPADAAALEVLDLLESTNGPNC
ncbi:MAG: hypothetical protein WDN04_02445 [Rhodospirillales bacterium]